MSSRGGNRGGGSHGGNRGGRDGGRGFHGGDGWGGRGSHGGGQGGGRGFRGGDRGGGHGSHGGDRGGYGRDSHGGHGRGFYGDGGNRRPSEDTISMPSGEQYEIMRPSMMPKSTFGQPIELLSNFYKLNFKNIVIYHYDIDIKEKLDSKKIIKEQNEKFLKKHARDLIKNWINVNMNVFRDVSYAYDGWKNLFSPVNLNLEKLSQNEIEEEIDLKKRTFIICIKCVKNIPLLPLLNYFQNINNQLSKIDEEKIMTILTVLEIIFGNVCEMSYSFFSRKYFDTDDVKNCQNGWIQFASGFAKAIRLTEFGPAMNIHLKTSCIISKTLNRVDELVVAYTGKQPNKLQEYELKKLNKLCRHMKIFTSHCGKRTFLIERFENVTPNKKIIDNEKGSIYDYFSKTYNIKVKDYPLIKTTGKMAKYLPMELCYLVEKQFLSNSKIDDRIQRDLLMVSTHRPDVYFQKTITYVNKIKQNGDRNSMLKNFGLDLMVKPVKLIGYVLPEPKQFKSRRDDNCFETPNKILKWVLFSLDHRINENQLKQFAEEIFHNGSKVGLKFEPISSTNKNYFVTKEIRIQNDVINIMKNINSNFNKIDSPLDIAFIIIPSGNRQIVSSEIYNLVKAFSERDISTYDAKGRGFGFITQCIKSDNVQRPKGGYFQNLLLKVNGKVGGINSVVDSNEFKKSKMSFVPATTMVIGIDVNHPNMDEKTGTSVAAAVGSYDPLFTKYTASLSVQQKDRDEIIANLDMMIKELLNEYKKKNGQFPNTLLVFRDGVSEGQFDKIKRQELPLIEKAAKSCQQNIKIVLFVVQKRHHTRFVSTKGCHGPKKNSYNVPSGTVVDNSIVDPKYDSFFVNSHFSPLGTSKPTKYVKIRDDLRLTSNQLQQLCFFMCFNCIRVRGVIAIPTPIRYADLCAYRSKLHIEAEALLNKSSGITAEKLISQLNRWVKIDKRVQNLLYYC